MPGSNPNIDTIVNITKNAMKIIFRSWISTNGIQNLILQIFILFSLIDKLHGKKNGVILT